MPGTLLALIASLAVGCASPGVPSRAETPVDVLEFVIGAEEDAFLPED